jgi:prolyl-tRNA synthetase
MKQSQLFTKTRREAPADEVSKNAQLLIRAGYIYKEMAGVYTLLPLGVRMVNKIADIVREEMNAIGGIETQSSALQKKEPWQESGRWSDEVTDVWFKTELKNKTQLSLAFTHEEPMTAMMRDYIASYKDLPRYTYDIRSIFRNEARAKSGLMRGREFFWKALYSFSRDEQQHQDFYEVSKQAYMNVFERVGLGDTTFLTFASGGSFSQYSHEFQTVCEAGEDTIYVDEQKGIAVNKEVYTDEVLADLGLNKESLVEQKAVEVGNIFSLGYKFSEPLNLKYTNEDGKQDLVYMGSYGIGISRLLGVIAENLSDDDGLVIPISVAPFTLHLVTFGDNEAVATEAESLYHDLKGAGIEVLFDDRDAGPGEKLRDADLIGIPYRLVVSEKAAENGGVEVKNRKTGEVEFLDASRLVAHFTDVLK